MHIRYKKRFIEEKNGKKNNRRKIKEEKKLTDRNGERETERQREPLGDLRSPIYFALVNFNKKVQRFALDLQN